MWCWPSPISTGFGGHFQSNQKLVLLPSTRAELCSLKCGILKVVLKDSAESWQVQQAGALVEGPSWDELDLSSRGFTSRFPLGRPNSEASTHKFTHANPWLQAMLSFSRALQKGDIQELLVRTLASFWGAMLGLPLFFLTTQGGRIPCLELFPRQGRSHGYTFQAVGGGSGATSSSSKEESSTTR